MRHLILAAVLMLVGTHAAKGEIQVAILNMPTEVYNFDPVYVLFAVTNRSDSAIYLPAEGSSQRGIEIYLARAGSDLRPMAAPKRLPTTPFPTRTMWLAPGERWLYLQDIGPGVASLDGEVWVQAVLSSMGKCGDEQIYGRQSFPLESLRLETFRNTPDGPSWEVYRCWEGDSHSEIQSVTVQASNDPEDFEAQKFVAETQRAPRRDDEQARSSRTWPRGLDTRYPQSRYTFGYLSRAGSDVHDKMLALELQPTHPLSPWVRGAVAKRVLDYRSSCWDVDKRPFDREGKEPPTIEASTLPAGVAEFLDQYRWYLENRHCPWILRNAEDKGWP
jgi:hypothetical protein